MRLNVYLQKAGAGSRREAERLVADGRVSVNGVIALPTTPVEEGDAVLIDGRPVAPETRPLPRLFLLHKPDDVKLLGIDEDTALVGDGHTWQVHGRQSVWELGDGHRVEHPAGATLTTP